MAAPTTNLDRSTTVTLANPTPPTNVAVDYQGTPPTPAGLVPVGAGAPAATGAFADPLEGTGKAEADGTEVSVTTPDGRVTTTSTLGDYTEFPQRDHPSSSGETGGGGEAVELVVSGDFASATGWTLSTSASIADGVLVFDGSDVGQGSRDDPVEPITAGNYLFEFDIIATDSMANVVVGVGGASLTVPGTSNTGHFSGTITTAAVSQILLLRAVESAAQLDNFSVKRAP